ncbi:GTP-binding protein ERG-like [Apium graveolens]|uniref:Uncharacterized protein n=1 Tax=Apium graveolens TaxID=4045 RepID=A0A6L5B945_APIGR|nr:hypothetical protein AG4045_018174 [Apium graveolens]
MEDEIDMLHKSVDEKNVQLQATASTAEKCFFETPGLILKRGGYRSKDIKVWVECAWSENGLYDILIVIFDVHRHLNSHSLCFPIRSNLLCC